MAGLRPAGKHALPFFMEFRRPKAHPNRRQKAQGLSQSLYGRMRSAPFGIAKECFLRARVVRAVAVGPLRRELVDIVVNALVAVPEDGTIRADFAKSSPNRPRAIDRCQAPSVGHALVDRKSTR